MHSRGLKTLASTNVATKKDAYFGLRKNPQLLQKKKVYLCKHESI